MTDSDDHFRARVTQDAFNDASATYWRRRAATFEAARPRPGDWIGMDGPDAYAALDRRICQTRDICLARADAAVGRPEERVA